MRLDNAVNNFFNFLSSCNVPMMFFLPILISPIASPNPPPTRFSFFLPPRPKNSTSSPSLPI